MYDHCGLNTNIAQVWVACNTSASQALLLKSTVTPEGFDNTNFAAVAVNYQTSFGSFVNDTSITGQWFKILRSLLNIIAPSGLTSILLPSVTGNVSSIRLTYYGIFESLPISC
jgi:hypothetical protein